MALKLPQMPEQEQPGTGSALVQLICFLILFFGIYLPLRKVVHAWYLRILILIADYAVVSLVTFLVIKPLAKKIEKKFQK